MEVRIAMREAGVLTGFLPGTPYFNGDEWPDFGLFKIWPSHLLWLQISIQNCYTNSIPFIGSLAVQRNGMSPFDALYSVAPAKCHFYSAFR